MDLTRPLQFEPIIREYLWGGRRLATELGKRLGSGERYAESWEIVDHGQDQSIVASGPFLGTALRELVERGGKSLFGRHHPRSQFPLLFKFLDAHQTLSVQVHPNDEQGARLKPPDLGKTEAWVVLAAEPGSKIYAGLKTGVTRTQLEAAVGAGACDRCLHDFHPNVGDSVLITAGTVHALGSGLVIAEIQQASDTTFRLFDWNRVDRDGRPRQLHVQESLETIDFSRGPVHPQTPQPTARPNVERLVQCEKFVLDRWRVTNEEVFPVDDRFHILAVVEGDLEINSPGATFNLRRGGTLLIPAACNQVGLQSKSGAVILDMYLP